MELAAHWHSCQNLPKNERLLHYSTGREMILSRMGFLFVLSEQARVAEIGPLEALVLSSRRIGSACWKSRSCLADPDG